MDVTLIQTAQSPLDAITVDARGVSPSELWQTLVQNDAFRQHLVDATRELLAGTYRRDWPTRLLEAGVTARDGRLAQLVGWLDRPPEADAHQDALQYLAAFGQGTVTVFGQRATLEEALDDDLASGPLALLDATDHEPTLAVRLSKRSFAEQPREQRVNTLCLLAELATVCDVRVVCTGLTARWLADTHRSDLPAEFGESLTTGRATGDPTQEVVDEALRALDVDGSAVELLRVLAEEPGQTVPQSSLSSLLCRDASTISQLLNTLEGLSLAERFSVGAGNHVELQPAGLAVIEAFDAELGRQASLDAQFDDTGHSHDRPCNHAHGRGGDGDGQGQQPPTAAADAATASAPQSPSPYCTRYLDRPAHTAAAGIATDGAFTFATADEPDLNASGDAHTRFVSYDADRDEAVVAVRATTALQYVTSVALSLASPRLFDQALPETRLDEIDVPPHILRAGRCIGGFSSRAEDDATVLRDRLIEWGNDLAEMTRKLKTNRCEDRAALRGEILRSAHGLAGTIVHLLDVVGVDLVREIRIPNGLSTEDLDELSTAMTVAASIQSRYGHFSTYRQLYEQRDSKRQSAIAPDVDAADPLGEYIGAMVVRSPRADYLQEATETRLSNPNRYAGLAVHDDAPEFGVNVSVQRVDRTDYAEVTSRMCKLKNLTQTGAATTLLRTLASHPWAVARALHWLSPEDRRREIRLDEVRVALASLDHDDLLPETTSTVSKTVAALLRSARPLTKQELAEKAGVSTRSLRREQNLAALMAVDLVRETERGYRLSLPFATDDERGSHIVPDAVDDALAAQQDLLFDLALEFVDDATRFGDPDDPVGGAFMGVPPDIKALRTACPAIDPWVRVSRLLCDSPTPDPACVVLGVQSEQQPLSV